MSWSSATGPDGALAAETIHPTAVQLFRFSATTWNAHRIHYDRPYAESEGYPGVLVQSHLHASWLAAYALRWAGPQAVLRRISWRNRAIAIPGDELTLQGTVVGTASDDEDLVVELTLSTVNQRGDVCVTGSASVALPGGSIVPGGALAEGQSPR